MDFLFIFAGLALLFCGGEGLVRGAVTIAEKLKLSTLLVSTVIIGFGTSTPELLVSIEAGLQGEADIALGNIVGSNISNTLLILGFAAAIAFIPCQTLQIRRDVLMGVGASLLLALLSFAGVIHRLSGLGMIAILLAYIVYSLWSEKRKTETKTERQLHEHIEEDMGSGKKLSMPVAILLTIFSLALLVAGAKLLVSGAVSIATQFGISEAVIGLTLVAVGTSLPELATAVIASLRRHTDVVIGNILGSNLFNILAILGLTAMIKPLPFTGRIADQDVWIMLATSAFLMAVVITGRKIGRGEGVVLLALYFSYVSWLYVSGG